MTAGFWVQARSVADRDLLRERRRGEVLWITIPFGVIAILGQIALLTFLDLKARPLFVSESFERECLSGN